MRAIQVQRNGGPEVLEAVEVPAPQPREDQTLVHVRYAGVNFIDVYHREGTYPIVTPFIPGLEGVGVVDGTGERVAWCGTLGSYAEQVAVPTAAMVGVPDGVPDDVAGAAMLQGLTAHYLVTTVHRIEPGSTALVHAAAGGVGQLLCQMIATRGGTVIATVSTPEKGEAALAAGAAHVISYDGFSDKVRDLTGGDGVDVVYDGVGKATFDGSLASLRRRGMLALFGAASGAPDPLDLRRLAAGGSLSVTRPSLSDFTATPGELAWRATEVFGAYLDGTLAFAIGGVYPLARAADAHRDLQSRRTAGKLLLDLG